MSRRKVGHGLKTVEVVFLLMLFILFYFPLHLVPRLSPRGIAGAIMRLALESACVLLAALAPASCFFTGTKAVIPSRISPRATSPSAVSMATQAPIAWPDEIIMPLPDQPIRARIIAVAPGDVASPFNDRGNSVPWYEVRKL